MNEPFLPGRWKELGPLLDAALDREPHERAAFLDEACAGDATLRAELEALLSESSRSDRVFATGAVERFAALLAEPQRALPEIVAGRYRVVREVGAGGMATVYLARDLKHDRNVALKVLKPELGAVLGVDRFLAEIKVTANLQHPNLLPLFDSGEADGLLFYVMPYVEGETLRARLDREKQLPVDEAVRIATALASALDYAHKAGVIHRDLKPENILLQAGQPVIADFGIALAVSRAGGKRVTESGLSLGTPQYMSPEQATADRVIDGRSDIYSLGAVTYEMLTGEAPHTGSTAQAIISRIMTEEPRPVRASRPSVPVHVEHAVHIALAKLPADRFSDAAAFGAALQGERSAIGTPASDGATEPARARRPLVWTAVAVLGVIVAFAIWKGSVGTTAPKVLRFAVKTPPNQGFLVSVGVSAVFTPDGSAIVYAGRGSRGTVQLYHRRLNEMEGTPLPGTEGATVSTISPSGDWVAFVSGGNISKVSLRGGAPVLVSKFPSMGISWGVDDAIFLGHPRGLFRVSAAGGPEQQVSVVDSATHEAGHYMPMALPDGKHVLVWSRIRPVAAEPGVERLAIVRVADGKVTALDGDALNPIGFADGYVVFGRPDGTLGVAPFDPVRTRSVRAVIPVSEAPLTRAGAGGAKASLSAAGDLVYVLAADSSRLLRLDAQGHEIRGERAYERNLNHPRISPDGRRIVVAEPTDLNRHSDLWVQDVASGVLQPLLSGGSARVPEWSPDGRRVVFILRPDQGPDEAWWMPADRGGGPAEQLVAMAIPILGVILSPDGSYAVVQTNDPKTRADLYRVDLKGDRTPLPLEQSAFNETQPKVSPDGRWLAYVSDEGGSSQVYVRPFPARGAHMQVSADGGSNPRWASDSRAIVYRAGDRFEKAVLAIGATPTVIRRDSLFSGPFLDYDLAANGTFVALRSGNSYAELMVVMNWIGELKARLAKK